MEQSLTQALASKGLSHRPTGRGNRHEVLNGEVVLFVGTASEVWAWLREAGDAEVRT